MKLAEFHVRIANEDLTFSAAHFITLTGGTCEPLHGHDWRVTAEVWGTLDESGCVVDFAALHQTLKKLLGELDHAVLLPTAHAAIRVEAREDEVEVKFQDRRWVLPQGDCRLLPLANTTAERLAQYLAERLRGELQAVGMQRPERLRIELQESPGYVAACEL